jgi:hypothetical protein
LEKKVLDIIHHFSLQILADKYLRVTLEMQAKSLVDVPV